MGAMDALAQVPLHERFHVRILHAGTMRVTSAWNRHRGSCFPGWVFYCNDAPGAFVRIRGRLWPLTPGRIILLPPWTTYDCVTTVDGVGHLYAVFDLVGLPAEVVRTHLRTLVYLPLDRPLRAACRAMDAALARAPLPAPATTFAVKAALYATLAPWWQQLPATVVTGIEAALAGRDQLTGALRLIEERLAAPLPVPALARACALSPAHFCRRFHRLLGQSPAAYVRERRLAAAATMLATTATPIPAIASACGFSDRYSFTRIFARRLGTPPAAYRRLQLRLPATPLRR